MTSIEQWLGMIRNIHYSILQRPAWQRYLIVAATFVIALSLFWIGLIFFIGFAVLALVVAVINRVKYKLTGRPLFKGPQHFHRYQSQFNQSGQTKHQGQVIEGEVIKSDQSTKNSH